MLVRILTAAVRANFYVQIIVGAVIVMLIDAYYALLIREGKPFQPSWLGVAIPSGVTLVWLIIASVALLVTWRDEQRRKEPDYPEQSTSSTRPSKQ